MSKNLIVENLTKKYGENYAVKNLNLYVDEGETVILIGSNGAGKTTAIHCILGAAKYNGKIKVCHMNNSSIGAKRKVGYIPEIPAPYDYLTVFQHLEFIARAYKLTNWRKRAESLMEQFNLIDEKDKLGTDLSKGMKQKLSICCALLIEPQMLLFDEPFIGLDPQAIVTVKNVIRKQKASGCSILISTHMLNMVEGMWDRAYIMSKGEVVAVVDNSVENLEEMFMDLTLNKES